MFRLNFEIKTLSPVILSDMGNSALMTKTHSEFSGSIVRGIFATRYVEENKIKSNAYEDADFVKLFYGGLKFLSANPICVGHRSFILPLSLQKAKEGSADAGKIQDLLTEENPAKGYKSCRGYAFVDDGKIFQPTVRKNTSVHISCASDSGRLGGRNNDGGIFCYESIDSGQSFCGEVIGSEDDLKQLVDGLKLHGKKWTVYAGKSRSTQYGKCKITLGEIKSIDVEKNSARRIFLRLDTPLISSGELFMTAKEILNAEVIDELNESRGEIFTTGKIFGATTEIDNFVVPWAMRRPRALALSAGSVFELCKIDGGEFTADDLKIIDEKIYNGFGDRTEEGFGQIRLWHSQNLSAPDKNSDKKKIAHPDKFSEETITLAKKILPAQFSEQLKIYAYEDAENLRTQLSIGDTKKHFFSRLEGLLGEVIATDNVQKNFATLLESEIRSGSSFEDHLEKVRYINGKSLHDVFTDENFAYYKIDVSKDEKLMKLFEEMNIDYTDFMANNRDRFFVDYMKNYLMFARKIAADESGGVTIE